MSRTSGIAAGLVGAVKALGLVGLVACGFDPAGQPGDGGGTTDAAGDDATTDGGLDAAVDAAIDAAIDAAGPPGALCDAADATLALCLTFDNDGTVNQAANGEQAASSTGTSAAGRVGTARGFDGTQAMWWRESAAFDLTEPITLEMFVSYAVAPPTTGSRRAGLFDVNGQYSVFLGWHDPDGPGSAPDAVTPYCNFNGTAWGAPVTQGAWHHVACVLAGGRLTIYTDGVAGESVNIAAAISTAGQDGMTLAQDCTNTSDSGTIEDPLTGRLDEVRLWDAARSASQIAAAAQRGQ